MFLTKQNRLIFSSVNMNIFNCVSMFKMNKYHDNKLFLISQGKFQLIHTQKL